MHVTIRQLKVFDSVARHLSYTKAADDLHLTQPAVSMQIKQLERAVDLPLFEVLGKRVYLTQAGETFHAHVQRILAQLKHAAEEMDALKGVDAGRVRVAIASTVNYFAARLIAKFCQLHQNVTINLEVTNRETLLQRLEANEPDMVLMGQPPEELELDAIPFMSNPLVAISAPDHPLLRYERITLENLAEQRLIMREPGSGTRNAIERVFREQGIEPVSRTEMTSNEAIKQVVEAGLGIAIVSRHTVELELSVGRLVEVPAETFPIVRKWYIAQRVNKRLSPAAQAFKEFVLAEGRAQEAAAEHATAEIPA